jgi:hypothetical protein
MLSRPTIKDARGRSVPLTPHEVFFPGISDAERRGRFERANSGMDITAIGSRWKLIFALLLVSGAVFALVPMVLAQRWGAPFWVRMCMSVLPALVCGGGSAFWTRRLAPRYIAETYLRARYCPSCGYDLESITPDADTNRTCPECGATWRLPSSPGTGEEMVAAQPGGRGPR